MKTSSETIEELLESSVADSIDTPKTELPVIHPKPEERRNFSRADVLEKNLCLDFVSGAQFAKQYIENISLGGLFVRTQQKASMGDILPIQFSIPTATGENRQFDLKGRVCRVTATGLGLEFTNLSNEMRHELEDFVKSVLPSGVPIVARAKASTIERLDERRLREAKRKEELKSVRGQLAILATMIFLNVFMTHRYLETQSEEKIRLSINPTLTIHGKTFSASSVKSIERQQHDKWLLHLANGTNVEASTKELDGRLPQHLQQSVEFLKHISAPKSPRISKNSPKLTRLR